VSVRKALLPVSASKSAVISVRVHSNGSVQTSNIYPAPLRSWINRHGGLTPKMIFLRGRELTGMVSTPQVRRSDTARAQRVR